jgi:hypothetical protein
MRGIVILSLAFALACGSSRDTVPTDDSYKKVATEFAAALVARDFARAYALTSSGFRSTMTQAAMQAQYEAMVNPIEPVSAVQLANTMEQWPAKQPTDVGWAYVAINGAEGGEAVTVVVTREADALRIRDVEWGRP